MTRKPLDQQEALAAWYPQQSLSITEALAAYITQPHGASGKSGDLGILQQGAIADLVCFTSDPFTMPQAELIDLLPQATMVDGEWVFSQT